VNILINNNDSQIEARHITIQHNDVEFRLSINKFNELVVQKTQFGNAESAIIIKPSVSNEIRLL